MATPQSRRQIKEEIHRTWTSSLRSRIIALEERNLAISAEQEQLQRESAHNLDTIKLLNEEVDRGPPTMPVVLDATDEEGNTPLHVAVNSGVVSTVAQLISSGVNVDFTQREDLATPLQLACRHGDMLSVELLLNAAASPDMHLAGRWPRLTDIMCVPPLPMAAIMNSSAGNTIAALLLNARANVNMSASAEDRHASAIAHAVENGNLPLVQMLSSRGASRHAQYDVMAGVEGIAESSGHHHVRAWLRQSRMWNALHHVLNLTEPRARTILRAGGNIHARGAAEEELSAEEFETAYRSPLEISRRHPTNAVARLIVSAAGPWSPTTHELFPDGPREYARDVLFLGYRLATRYGHPSVIDVWIDRILPAIVVRDLSSFYQPWGPNASGIGPGSYGYALYSSKYGALRSSPHRDDFEL